MLLIIPYLQMVLVWKTVVHGLAMLPDTSKKADENVNNRMVFLKNLLIE